MASRIDILRGTLDLLILQALTHGPNHGVGVARRIRQVTQGRFDAGPGSLFPALHRLEERGWLKAEWGDSENNRRARYYRLTAAGRRELLTATERWEQIAEAIGFALKAAKEV